MIFEREVDRGQVSKRLVGSPEVVFTFFHNFEMGWHRSRDKSLPTLARLEEVIVRIRPESTRCRIRRTLGPAEIESLPLGFNCEERALPSGEKIGNVSSPCALDGKALMNWKAPAEKKNKIWRLSWRNGFSAEIVQLKSRITDLKPGMPITATVVRIRMNRDAKTLKVIEAMLDSGVSGLVLARHAGDRLRLEERAKVDLDV